MKKTFSAAALVLLTACAPCQKCGKDAAAIEPVIVETDAMYIEETATLCGCSKVDPCREILRPRVKEIVVNKPRRNCGVDTQAIDCGCGVQRTFSEADVEATEVVKEIIPDMPEAYVLASNRVLNRIYKDTPSIYGQNPHVRLHVRPAKALSSDLPGGIEKGNDNTKRQIASSSTFVLTNSMSDADYYLETTADWFDTMSKTVPAIEYRSVLFDKNHNKIREWIEIIKKADNTQSWL